LYLALFISDFGTFVQNGADMNKTDFYSLTPLQRATEFGHIDVVEYLLQAGLHNSAFFSLFLNVEFFY